MPPSGAKGLNLAVGDVVTLARVPTHERETGSTASLDAYSAACLRRVRQTERFLSSVLTPPLHHASGVTVFEGRPRLAPAGAIASFHATGTDLAEACTGFPPG